MLELIKRNRKQIDRDLNQIETRRFFSPVTYEHTNTTLPLLMTHLKGKCIDVGCGDLPYRQVIATKVDQYDTFDIERRDSDVKYIGDVQRMDMIPDNTYDSALCLEVLEHVPHPGRAMCELFRILKDGGKLVLSVPHISRLHEEPNDYFRFTRYGLQVLFHQAGFQVVCIQPYGGIFSFVGHQVSTFWLCLVWHIPVIKEITFFLNKWLIVRGMSGIDRILDQRHLAPIGYTCVVEKSA